MDLRQSLAKVPEMCAQKVHKSGFAHQFDQISGVAARFRCKCTIIPKMCEFEHMRLYVGDILRT